MCLLLGQMSEGPAKRMKGLKDHKAHRRESFFRRAQFG
jgi:hypothetical protein